MSINHLICLAVILLLSISANRSLALDQDTRLQIGSTERRELCDSFAELIVEAHDKLSAGMTLERYKKELEIAFAGQDEAGTLVSIVFLGGFIADLYVKEDRSAEDLRIDFLHPCVTTEKTISDVMEVLALETVPADHPLRSAVIESEDEDSLGLEPDGTLSAKSYRTMLGDEFQGTHVVEAYGTRKDGAVNGCGIEFAHMQYDYVYSQGRPVKLSGSVNFNAHPVQYIAALVKVKGENMVISQSTTGEPSVEMIVFDIETLYPTLNGEPILDDAEIFQCEDKDYTCQVNFEWEKIFESISSNQSGIAYRRTGGGTDAVVELDWEQPEGADKEIFKFNDCLGELAANALKRAQDDANNQ